MKKMTIIILLVTFFVNGIVTNLLLVNMIRRMSGITVVTLQSKEVTLHNFQAYMKTQKHPQIC